MRIAIINRSFWPKSSVIGESLLQLAEALAKQGAEPIVITLVDKEFQQQLLKADRGHGVCFSTLRSMTDSSSAIPLRVLELFFFTVFVFFSLCWHKPDKVYVSTNPPIFVPLAVRWYCSLLKKKYVYHLQDIHPEATEVVTGKKGWLGRQLIKLDNKTIEQADTIITLTEQMKAYLLKRTKRQELPIVLLDNPAAQDTSENIMPRERIKGFVFCGNAGRLQRIPLLITAIKKYLDGGGKLPFVFAGGGVYRQQLEALAEQYDLVTHVGVLPAAQAAELMRSYTYGLMPIEDEVTNYAFPSKSSSYVFAGCTTIAICGRETSVGRWVEDNGFGYVVEPSAHALLGLFWHLERAAHSFREGGNQDAVWSFTIQNHVRALRGVLQTV